MCTLMCTFEIFEEKCFSIFCLKVPKIGMVRIKRLELPRLSAPDPKSGVSTNFTISAHNSSKVCEAEAPS